ncbi:MAG: hypothetical protein ACT4NY_12700 [Pseudonocardiales bacterium]
MRSMGYAAAVAAGLIVPLAFVLPSSAGAQSLAFSGVSHFVGSFEGDDNDDNGDANGYDDGNRDRDTDRDRDRGDGLDRDDNGNDRNDREDWPEDSGNWNDSQPDVTVYGAGLTTSGDVAFVVRVSDAGAFDTVTLNSPALDTGCALNNVTGATAQADRFGNLIFSAQAVSCIPGNYKIAVTESAEETYYGDVTIR